MTVRIILLKVGKSYRRLYIYFYGIYVVFVSFPFMCVDVVMWWCMEDFCVIGVVIVAVVFVCSGWDH